MTISNSYFKRLSKFQLKHVPAKRFSFFQRVAHIHVFNTWIFIHISHWFRVSTFTRAASTQNVPRLPCSRVSLHLLEQTQNNHITQNNFHSHERGWVTRQTNHYKNSCYTGLHTHKHAFSSSRATNTHTVCSFQCLDKNIISQNKCTYSVNKWTCPVVLWMNSCRQPPDHLNQLTSNGGGLSDPPAVGHHARHGSRRGRISVLH